MSIEEILNDLINDFNIAKFDNFFRQKSRLFRPVKEDLSYYESDNFTNGKKIGEIKLEDENQLIICAFQVNKRLTERSGKKAQYIIGKKILKDSMKYAGGIFIFYDFDSNFRFSLIHDIPKAGGRRDWSNFKRYTYYVSRDQTNKTFIRQMKEADFSGIGKLIEAFSVEKVTKVFYQEIANWYFWALRNVKFPKDAESEQNGKNISVIRLITRLIFIWFMKQKNLIKENLFNEDVLKNYLKDLSPDEGTYYKAILQNLFFATLNTPINKRRFRTEHRKDGFYNEEYMNHNYYRYNNLFKNPEDMPELFNDIPFLNGGLFECLDKAKNDESNDAGREIRIDGFTDVEHKQPYVPNFLFFSDEIEVDLNPEYGTKNKKYTVRGLINVLKSYNFTIDENTPIDEEVALDPELLGRVFENLLASYNPETATTARKATGSYYTPRPIVDYMVEQSLKEYFETKLEGKITDIENKLENLFSYESETNPFNEDETTLMVEAINALKVLDPAVGSGAFPMGILHKLVFILSKLDPHNIKWKEQQIKAIEKYVFDPLAKQEAIKDIEKAFKNNELDYGRKLFLIQNCLYGVDIQPIAIQIAKLRFFISLLVDEKVNPEEENHGIKHLPNLETKLVAANTLVGLDKTKNLQIPEIENLENELFKVRNKYFSVFNVEDKNKLKKVDKILRTEIKKFLEKGGFPSEYSEKIASWDPYNTTVSADWFDPEWMFGVKDGFDIVIGNPPYGIKIPHNIVKNYSYYDRKKNSASLFIELGTIITKKDNGLITLIVPKSLTFSEGWRHVRDFVSDENKLLFVIDVSKAFEHVLLEQVIVGFKNISDKIQKPYFFHTGEGWTDKIITISRINSSLIGKLDILPVYIDSKKENIYYKVFKGSIPLSLISYTCRGLPVQKLVSRDGLQILRGKNIGRYKIYGKINHVPSYVKNFEKATKIRKTKIISQNIVAHVTNPTDHLIIMATLDDRQFLTFDTVMNTFVIDNNFILEYVLALLNSKFASWFYYWFVYNRAIRTMHFDRYYLGKLPIKNISIERQNDFARIVSNILSKKKQNPYADTAELEAEIDQLIYRLYGLTDDEIKIIEENQ